MREIHNDRGYVIAAEATEPGEVDMIAKGLLDNDGEPWPETPTLTDLLLVPAPFVLTCSCGMEADPEIPNRSQAMREGWRDIEFTPESLGENYEGTCPDCVKESGGTARAITSNSLSENLKSEIRRALSHYGFQIFYLTSKSI